jgi:8-amino-7-oxononanoate synthase
MRSLDEFAGEKLAALERAQLRRTPVVTARAGIWAERNGRRLLSFSCNDYLNLSQHPEVVAAAIAATTRHGVGAGASRLVTGNHPLYAELENRLARLKGTEAACVFGSGYLANTGIIPALVGPDDLILVDEFSHACIHGGAKLSGAAVHLYRHADVAHVEAILAAHRTGKKRALIATDGVFSMDGNLAPLGALSALAQRFDAWLLADDAHGLGVVGGGRGSSFVNKGGQTPHDVPLQMGTLSKAVGAYGGYLCASRAVIDFMRTRARTFIYSTGLPPSVIAAATAALDIIERDPSTWPKHRALSFR